MIEIHSAQELVDSLINAGDRLVIVDFYSPGCGGCNVLHPIFVDCNGEGLSLLWVDHHPWSKEVGCLLLHIYCRVNEARMPLLISHETHVMMFSIVLNCWN